MTEREYFRLRDRIWSLSANSSTRGEISQERFHQIWAHVARGEENAEDFGALMAAATRAKRRLLKYVEQEGPFVFEDGRCLFIDVGAFELEHWQWPKIPVRDVTPIAQNAFLSEYERGPRAYFYDHRNELLVFGIVTVAIVLLLSL